ncbi:hypothetical protein BDW60DRAFT_183019 [Aspergillus nidulans var. acristatus]
MLVHQAWPIDHRGFLCFSGERCWQFGAHIYATRSPGHGAGPPRRFNSTTVRY